MYENERDAEIAIAELNATIATINYLVEQMQAFDKAVYRMKAIERRKKQLDTQQSQITDKILTHNKSIIETYSDFCASGKKDTNLFKVLCEKLDTARKLQDKATELQATIDYNHDSYINVVTKYNYCTPACYEQMLTLYRDRVAKYNSQILRVLYYVKPPEGKVCKIGQGLFKSEREVKSEEPFTIQSLLDKIELLNIEDLKAEAETETDESEN